MTSQITAAGSSSTSASDTSTTNPVAKNQINESTFLTLLVAQIKNQDPLQPQDGLQFVSELSQFSQLEQLIQMKSDLDTIMQQTAPATAESSGSGS